MEQELGELAPGLWIGSYKGMKESWADFDAVVTIMEPFAYNHNSSYGTPRLMIPVRDEPCCSLLPYWPAVIEFVRTQKKLGKRVLIHCWAGKSRSASTCIAVLKSVYFPEKSLEELFLYVVALWPRAAPKEHWRKELEVFFKES